MAPAIARQCFEEARELCTADGGKLWGVSLCGPVLFVDGETRAVIANQADAEGRLTPNDGVFVGVLPEEQIIAGTVIRWAGVDWTMLPWPLPSEKGERQHMLAHEMFHRVQPRLNLRPPNAATGHLDTRDGRIWLQLEWRALRAALEATGDEQRQDVTDALVFRAYRRLLVPDAVTGELSMEIVEGTAEYTGVRLSTDSESAAIARTLRNFEWARDWPTYTYSFAYVSGPAYGLLLDRALPGWRKKLVGNRDMGELLRQALSIELPADLAAAVEQRGTPVRDGRTGRRRGRTRQLCRGAGWHPTGSASSPARFWSSQSRACSSVLTHASSMSWTASARSIRR